jgi:hypothetical protein
MLEKYERLQLRAARWRMQSGRTSGRSQKFQLSTGHAGLFPRQSGSDEAESAERELFHYLKNINLE